MATNNFYDNYTPAHKIAQSHSLQHVVASGGIQVCSPFQSDHDYNSARSQTMDSICNNGAAYVDDDLVKYGHNGRTNQHTQDYHQNWPGACYPPVMEYSELREQDLLGRLSLLQLQNDNLMVELRRSVDYINDIHYSLYDAGVQGVRLPDGELLDLSGYKGRKLGFLQHERRPRLSVSTIPDRLSRYEYINHGVETRPVSTPPGITPDYPVFGALADKPLPVKHSKNRSISTSPPKVKGFNGRGRSRNPEPLDPKELERIQKLSESPTKSLLKITNFTKDGYLKWLESGPPETNHKNHSVSARRHTESSGRHRSDHQSPGQRSTLSARSSNHLTVANNNHAHITFKDEPREISQRVSSPRRPVPKPMHTKRKTSASRSMSGFTASRKQHQNDGSKPKFRTHIL